MADAHAHGHVHPRQPDMLSVEEALARVLALVHELPAEDAPILDAVGQTLAADVRAPFDVPALANSAMDGYAVRAADTAGASAAAPAALRVIGQIQAGGLPTLPVGPGEAVRIMTGAPVPQGADAVVPWELTNEADLRRAGQPHPSVVEARRAASPGDHVRPSGEDAAAGSLVLSKGRVLDPPAVGMLAAFGYASCRVVRRPRVAVLATGDEVQAPGEPLRPGHLYDSNTYGVAAALTQWGAEPVLLGVAGDDMDALRERLRAGLDADMLVTSAGVSAGAFDIVKDALAEFGSIDFWSVRMRPSRPLAFGLLRAPGGRSVPHLGLPGNPVSALVALAQFARPAVAKMMGREPTPLPRIEAVAADAIVNFDGRRVYARVTLSRKDGRVHARLTGAQGSNLLTSMAAADGLAICPEDTPEIPAGGAVAVELLDWRGHAHLFASTTL